MLRRGAGGHKMRIAWSSEILVKSLRTKPVLDRRRALRRRFVAAAPRSPPSAPGTAPLAQGSSKKRRAHWVC